MSAANFLLSPDPWPLAPMSSTIQRPPKIGQEIFHASLREVSPIWLRVLTPGDLLLYRGDDSLMDLAIADEGRGPWVHAAMLDYVEEQWQVLETLQRHGGRRKPLAEAVAENPGQWDVFTIDPDSRWPEFSRYLALEKMRSFVGMPYGWAGIIRLAASRIPVLGRRFWPVTIDDDAPYTLPPFCSDAVSAACRAGGVDPVPHLADYFTEPSDLARSLFFQYALTLVP